MLKKKVSIIDIARQLNLSITAVSFVLNGKAEEKRISKEVTQKVLKLAEELEYKPNQLAKSLRTGKTNIIGLMIEDIANPFFANVARLIEENAYDNGYKILYCSTENDTKKCKELINMFRERYVDGYIITPPAGVEADIQSLIKAGLPVILFDRYFPQTSTDYVMVDNYGGTYQATEHLLQQGFQNIAFITIESEQMQMGDRLSGFQAKLKEEKKEGFIKKVVFHQNAEVVNEQIANFLKANPQLDAVIFATNYLGISGLKAIKKLGLKIPADLAVISFDDNDLFQLYTPPITVIAQPVEELSKQVIKILLNRLSEPGKVSNEQTVILPTTLLVRESSLKNKPA